MQSSVVVACLLNNTWLCMCVLAVCVSFFLFSFFLVFRVCVLLLALYVRVRCDIETNEGALPLIPTTNMGTSVFQPAHASSIARGPTMDGCLKTDLVGPGDDRGNTVRSSTPGVGALSWAFLFARFMVHMLLSFSLSLSPSFSR